MTDRQATVDRRLPPRFAGPTEWRDGPHARDENGRHKDRRHKDRRHKDRRQKTAAKKTAAKKTAATKAQPTKRGIRKAVKSGPVRPIYRYYLPEPTVPGPTVVTFNELVHNASDALQRTAGGESFVITVHRQPICRLVQYTARRATTFADVLADEKPIAVSVLRQDTAYRIYRAQAGIPAVVTLRGKPLAMLVPIRRRTTT